MKRIKIKQYHIYLDPHLIEILLSYRQLKLTDKESGGILFGQVKEDNIYLLRLSIPNSVDKAGRKYFIRNKQIAQVLIKYEFMNSSSKTIYMGEWHTHPEEFPKPSKTDVKMINDQFNENKLSSNFLISIIQGLKGIHITLIDENGTYSYELIL